jgi:coproporphyrinogen III oxidase-like Fe-S oxidoreductase
MLESGIYPKSWEAISPDAQAISDEYVHVSEILENLGYEHYEVSNWAKP